MNLRWLKLLGIRKTIPSNVGDVERNNYLGNSQRREIRELLHIICKKLQ